MDMTKIESKEVLKELIWTLERHQRDVKAIQKQVEKVLIQIAPEGDGKSNRPKIRRRRGHKSYEVLILEALREMDGRGTADKVCDLVEEKRGIDFKKHSCTACRAKMVRKGWLKDNLDTSTWEITDEGRAWLAEVG